MANITYLLGAGASFKAMPIVSNMSNHIMETVKWVEDIREVIKNQSEKPKIDFHILLTRLNELAELCRLDKNFSIDTYAKKLLHQRKLTDYKRLKKDISLYFLLQQRKSGIDLRYDNFWASILDGDSLPTHIKVLSWNYDYQLELSYQDFIDNRSLKETASMLKIKHPSEHYEQNVENEFCIFKLNGSATVRRVTGRDPDYMIDDMKYCDV